MSNIPSSWLTKVPMKRLHGHWTAGGNRANSTDVKAYHFLWEGDGKVVRGVDVAKNSGSLKDGYAAHTLNANSDAIGGSMCGMMGAVESPFNAGPAPLTLVQWNAFVRDTAQIIDFYGIPIGKKTTLFHAEVQANLGIKQRNKWDVVRLPFDPGVVGAAKVGDKWRDEMRAVLKGTTPTLPLEPPEPIPAGGTAVVVAKSGLHLRRGPSTDQESRGLLPNGTILEITGPTDTEWVEVKTPAGYDGWVKREFIKMVDGPAPVEATVPDPRRSVLEQMRKAIDEIESQF